MTGRVSLNLRAVLALCVTLTAVLLAVPEGRAQSQNPVLPKISVATARFFQANPEARSQFLAGLPRRPAGPSQASPPMVSPPVFGGTWTAVTTAPVSGLCNPLLLTDATVIMQNCATGNWYKLTPTNTGSYSGGTWTQIASMQSGYGPQYNASAVLPDGRVIIMGGEYNVACNSGNTEVWTSLGAIYDPVANTWAPVSPPSGTGWTNTDACGSVMANGGIGDAASIVLPNGTFMLSACCANPPLDALFNPTTLGWSATGVPSNYQDEQGYTLLPNGNVLTIDVWDPPNAQAYNFATGTWSAVAGTPVSLIDPTTCGNYEIGPSVTRPDGTVVAFGGNTGCTASPADPTAIYTVSSNSWVQGPNVPAVCGSGGTTSCDLADAPAALLPNGNILFAASNGYGKMPTHFFEFTSATSSPANTINQVSDPLFNAGTSGAYYYNFLALPNGQILMTDFSDIAEVYTPTGSANSAWAPTATAPACVDPGSSYVISGTQLNGLSQGAAYGDDVQGATNYPLVKIVNNSTSHVVYARTTGFSTMSIAPGQIGSANFQVAAATATGASTLYVVANGIASAGTAVTVATTCPISKTDTHDFNADGKSDVLWHDTSGDIAIWEMDGTAVLNPNTAGLGNLSTAWSIVGTGDFNGDGKSDILLRDTSGDVAIWEMNGTTILNPNTAGVGNVAGSWQIVGTGDFNGDGKSDILWRDGTGNVAIWLMNGTAVLNVNSAFVGLVPTATTTWQIVGTGDFNGDGKWDILWRDGSGNVAIWEMNGTTVLNPNTAGVGNVPTNWSIVGTGDFNGDGKSDILWHDSIGDVAIWEMNGTSVLNPNAAGVGNVATTFQIAGSGDYNGDGKSDVLWRDSSGNVAIWEMNGTTVLNPNTAGVGNVAIAWTIQDPLGQ
jgi:hypothetical protein